MSYSEIGSEFARRLGEEMQARVWGPGLPFGSLGAFWASEAAWKAALSPRQTVERGFAKAVALGADQSDGFSPVAPALGPPLSDRSERAH